MQSSTPDTEADKSRSARLEVRISAEQKAALQHAASALNTHALRSVTMNYDA